MSKNYTSQTAALKTVTHDTTVLNAKKIDTTKFNATSLNTTTATVGSDFKAVPLGVKNALGQDAYGISVSYPSADGLSGGLQLWGVQFMTGDNWSDNALKIVHNKLALYGTGETPASISFDYANNIEFKTMPDDGGTVGATYDFQSWTWNDDSHTTMSNNGSVQILKNNSTTLTDKSVMNMGESDDRYAQLHAANTFTEANTFEETVETQSGINVTGGDIVVAEGVLAFEDLIDGTITKRNGVTGYQWLNCSSNKPTSWNNGICYDFGTLTAALDLSTIRFSGTNDLVQTCEVWFKTGSTAYTVTFPTGTYWIDSATGAAPTLLANKHYRLVLRQEPNKIIASVAYLY